MQQRYNSIGSHYDHTRNADPDILRDLASFLFPIENVRDVVDNSIQIPQQIPRTEIATNLQILDVGCGSGNYTRALAAVGGHWTGVDPSDTMLSQARAKQAAAGDKTTIRWLQADAENLPFPDHHFDGVLCSLCIHHFSNLAKSIEEIARVLVAHGRFVIFTATPRQMLGYWLWHYFPEMMRGASAQMPSLAAIDKLLVQVGLRVAQIKPYWISPRLQDKFLYSGKYQPEYYLSEEIRNGISSFHLFCSERELTDGLRRLESDINSGEIKTIQKQYRSPAGEYMTIQIEPEASLGT